MFQHLVQSFLEALPPPWREAVVGFFVSVSAALAGRMMHHARQVQAGRRRFFSVSLLWELPIALGTGLIGRGLADYWSLGDGVQATALVVTVAYLGPGFVEAVVWRLVDRLAPKAGAA